MIIPITQRYNHALPSIGSVEPSDRGLRVRLVKGTSLSREEIFQIFGCPGVEVNEQVQVGDELRYTDFTIREFTRPASYEAVGTDEVIRRAHLEGRANAFDDLAKSPFRLSLSKRHFTALRDRELAKIGAGNVRPIRPTPRPTGGKLINGPGPDPIAALGGWLIAIYVAVIAGSIVIPLVLHFKGAM